MVRPCDKTVHNSCVAAIRTAILRMHVCMHACCFVSLYRAGCWVVAPPDYYYYITGIFAPGDDDDDLGISRMVSPAGHFCAVSSTTRSRTGVETVTRTKCRSVSSRTSITWSCCNKLAIVPDQRTSPNPLPSFYYTRTAGEITHKLLNEWI